MASWKTQNNHYVSQFILRGFSSNREKNKIWRYDLITSEIRGISDCEERAISKVWFLNKWWSQEVEDFFWKEFEVKAADISYRIQESIKYFEEYKKVNQCLHLTKKDVESVIEFLVMQFVRSIAVSKYIEKSMNKFIDTGFVLQETANQICSRVESLIPGFIQDEVSYLSHRELRIAFLNPIWLKGFTEKIREYLMKKQMNIFWIPKHRWLITSDFPIAFPNQKYGVAYPDSEWWFPLTKNIVIAFWELRNTDKIQYAYSPIIPKQLDSLNRGIACQATRYIFWHSKELVLKYGRMHKKVKQSFVFENL
jgi:Protein of unknown function (DUF4238)